ncbi:unnamed protein product [Merluccius merluccius]
MLKVTFSAAARLLSCCIRGPLSDPRPLYRCPFDSNSRDDPNWGPKVSSTLYTVATDAYFDQRVAVRRADVLGSLAGA